MCASIPLPPHKEHVHAFPRPVLFIAYGPLPKLRFGSYKIKRVQEQKQSAPAPWPANSRFNKLFPLQMPKTFAKDFTKAVTDFIQSAPRAGTRWVSQGQEGQKNPMYHKWTREEEISLCRLIANYSTNWELINRQHLQQFNVLQLKNKYREIVSDFNLHNGKKPKKQERAKRENSSAGELTAQKEEEVYKVLRSLLAIQ
ncbi:Myb-like_DNA-binding domain-containing protein [Hexamita inflata]|uniref:Myb-like DNA-binding domain-containing protein n=1 Tax=Hexamita inflata TaxID=28002 RepID=A0AA86RKV2_9EUKA|nr:Myb-like DNA-binding domain-containing protein [Hexamita inflata]